MAITPVILPPEAKSRSATEKSKQRLVTPLSRRLFRKEYKWGYQIVQNLEPIAYYTIPLYRQGVIKRHNRFEGELTGYHQWVLLKIRCIRDKIKDLEEVGKYVHGLEQIGAFTQSEYQKDWINWLD